MMRILILIMLVSAGFGCKESETRPAPAEGCPSTWNIDGHNLTLQCDSASVRLSPVLIIDDEWLVADTCGVSGTSQVCQFEGHGELSIDLSESDQIQGQFSVTHSMSLNGIALVGNLMLPGANAWLSNGFQSWSQSGVLDLRSAPTDEATHQAVRAIGDLEVLRTGRENSWWHTFVRADTSFVVGATSAKIFKSWIQVSGEAPELNIKLVNGATGEQIALSPGDEVKTENWFVQFNEKLTAALNDFGAALPRRTTSSARPEAGWNSWYELWSSVDEEAVRSNATLARGILEPLTDETLRIVIDDGWQQYWGNWQSNEKFPSGVDGLAEELKADGFNVGIWLAPLLVEEESELAQNHPDWFVEGAYFGHLGEGNMLVLDVTHPEAAQHIRESVERIVSWGFDLLKIDFLFAGTFEGGRNEAMTGMQAYERALALIRSAAGPDVVLLAVGAPPIAGFDHVDAWRIGPDIAVENFDASWFFIPSEARTIGARWPYCDAVLCDGDPPILRAMARNEVEVSLWTAALAGGAFFLSDDLRTLEEERSQWITPGMVSTALFGQPSMPEPAVPDSVPSQLATQLFDHTAGENRHEVPALWSIPGGGTLHLNFGDEPMVDGELTVPARSAVLE